MYEKQGFYSGQPLTAEQLNVMEDGIIAAQRSNANVEIGAGETAIQQAPRADKVTQAGNETCPHFSFTGQANANMAGRIQYGAIGNYSVSMNGRSAALSKHAFAINNSTIAKGEESFAQGYETIAEGNSSSATGSRTWAVGEASHTEGLQTYAGGEGSHAEGSSTRAEANYSHAEGYLSAAKELYAHAEGSSCEASGMSSHAEGNATFAESDASHTEGSNTKVAGFTVVESGTNGSTGGGSGGSVDVPNYDEYESLDDYKKRGAACGHSEGNNTSVIGYGGHAEGVGSNAYGHASHAEGWCTQAGDFIDEVNQEDGKTYRIANREVGLAAHAEGYNTKAIGNYSHASGFETTADQSAQTVVGQYNKESHVGSVFVVGGGESAAARKNALEVLRDGEIIIRWNDNYYSLNLMLNLISNAHGGPNFFNEAIRK